MKMKLIISLVAILFLNTNAYTQKYEIGLLAGGSLYTGDLAKTPFFIDETKPSVSLFGQYYLGDQVSLRSGLTFGKIAGDDLNKETSAARNLNFESKIFEFSALVSYDILDVDLSNIVPYVYGGFAAFHHNPTTEINGVEVELQPLGTEGQGIVGYGDKYSLWNLALPLGAGVKYKLREDILLRLDWGTRFTFTKYLDDIGGVNYANPRDLLEGNGQTAYLAAYRADELEGGLPYTALEDDATRARVLRSSENGYKDLYHFIGIGGSYFISDAFNSKMQKNRKKVPYKYSRY